MIYNLMINADDYLLTKSGRMRHDVYKYQFELLFIALAKVKVKNNYESVNIILVTENGETNLKDVKEYFKKLENIYPITVKTKLIKGNKYIQLVDKEENHFFYRIHKGIKKTPNITLYDQTMRNTEELNYGVSDSMRSLKGLTEMILDATAMKNNKWTSYNYLSEYYFQKERMDEVYKHIKKTKNKLENNKEEEVISELVNLASYYLILKRLYLTEIQKDEMNNVEAFKFVDDIEKGNYKIDTIVDIQLISKLLNLLKQGKYKNILNKANKNYNNIVTEVSKVFRGRFKESNNYSNELYFAELDFYTLIDNLSTIKGKENNLYFITEPIHTVTKELIDRNLLKEDTKIGNNYGFEVLGSKVSAANKFVPTNLFKSYRNHPTEYLIKAASSLSSAEFKEALIILKNHFNVTKITDTCPTNKITLALLLTDKKVQKRLAENNSFYYLIDLLSKEEKIEVLSEYRPFLSSSKLRKVLRDNNLKIHDIMSKTDAKNLQLSTFKDLCSSAGDESYPFEILPGSIRGEFKDIFIESICNFFNSSSYHNQINGKLKSYADKKIIRISINDLKQMRRLSPDKINFIVKALYANGLVNLEFNQVNYDFTENDKAVNSFVLKYLDYSDFYKAIIEGKIKKISKKEFLNLIDKLKQVDNVKYLMKLVESKEIEIIPPFDTNEKEKILYKKLI